MTVSPGHVTVTITGDFNGAQPFQPGPGDIQLVAESCVLPVQSGFNAVIATFVDTLSAPITWTH